MKKFNLFIAILFLSLFTCFSFAVLSPDYNWKICNIITNLDEYLKDYYMVIDCDDLWCNGDINQPFIIVRDNIKCFSWWGYVSLIPKYIKFESLETDNKGTRYAHLSDKRRLQIWMIQDKSENGDLTYIHKIIQNGTWIKLELTNKYEWYNVQIKMDKNSNNSWINPYSAILEIKNFQANTPTCYNIKTIHKKYNTFIAWTILILYIILFIIYYIIHNFKRIDHPVRKSLINSLISATIISIILLWSLSFFYLKSLPICPTFINM